MGDRIMNVELNNGQKILFTTKETEFILSVSRETGLNVHDLLILSVLSVDNTEHQSLFLNIPNHRIINNTSQTAAN